MQEEDMEVEEEFVLTNLGGKRKLEFT